MVGLGRRKETGEVEKEEGQGLSELKREKMFRGKNARQHTSC